MQPVVRAQLCWSFTADVAVETPPLREAAFPGFGRVLSDWSGDERRPRTSDFGSTSPPLPPPPPPSSPAGCCFLGLQT